MPRFVLKGWSHSLLMLLWSKYLMRYPKDAKVSTAESSLNRNLRSSGDLSRESLEIVGYYQRMSDLILHLRDPYQI
jgi:hypothetical protein